MDSQVAGRVPHVDIDLSVGDTVTLEIAGLRKLVNFVITADSGLFDWLTSDPAKLY